MSAMSDGQWATGDDTTALLTPEEIVETPADLETAATKEQSTARITVALGEYDTGWHDPQASIAAASRLVTRVAEVGADIVVLPELATTGATIESERAVSIESHDVDALRDIARAHRMWLIAGVALRDDEPAASAVNAVCSCCARQEAGD